ncbi:MAG: hypothetical protein FE037_01850 [Thermoplasmata archaeon]|nr:MAG: hypothetical protein FE037_01850 [Thermoplasmata archaeon]
MMEVIQGLSEKAPVEDEEVRQEAAMDIAGQRKVPNIDLSLNVVWNGDASMTITVSATNNVIDTELTEMPDELTNQRNITFEWKATSEESSNNWHIRVYVTEIVSRWNDYNGNPYHFGFLGYAINKPITIGPGDTYTETVEWDGAAHGYGDITQDNIMVIAAIFDSNGYSVEAASAVPSLKSKDSISDQRAEILYSYKLEGYDSDWSDWTTDTSVTYHNLENGLYTFKVKSKVGDLEDMTPAECTFRVDATPPDTVIISGPSGEINTNSAVFEWEGSDNYSPDGKLLYSYRLEGFDNNWSVWTPEKSVSYENLPAGTFTFEVKTIDEAGNEDPTPASRTFTVLRPEPYTTIVSGPEGYIDSNDVTFVWTGTDDSTPIEELLYSYKLEGYDSDWSDWTSETTVTYTGLEDGQYTFMVRSKDTDGYIDPEPATRTFMIDTQKPQVSIEKPLRNRLYIGGISIPFVGTWIIFTSVDIEATATDNSGISEVKILINGEEKANFSSQPYIWTWSEKAFGKQTITVEAYDLAGNKEVDELSVLKFF